jgi:transglutaminase-like putative cysteine protease
MSRRRPAPADVLFAIATTLAISAALLAFRAWWLAPALVAAALSPFLEWKAVPPTLARMLPLVVRILLMVTFLAIWFTRPMPLLLDQESRWIPRVLGVILAVLAAVFALARPRFPDGRALVPTLIGLLVAAGADPAPSGFGSSALTVFSAAGHNAFAELYAGLVALVAVLAWAAFLVGPGPSVRGRLREALLPIVVALGLCGLSVVGLPAAQPRVEKAMADAMNPSAATGLSSGATLGDFGELAVSRRRVLDLRASTPEGTWLLRAESLADFDGRRWTTGGDGSSRTTRLRPERDPAEGDALLAGLGTWFRPLPAAPPDGVRLRITQQAVDTWPLLLPHHVAAVSAATQVLEQDGRGFLRRPGAGLVPLYGAVLTRRPPGPVPMTAAERARALAQPPRVDARIAALAASLAPPGTTERELLARTVLHLQAGYRYTLQPGPFRRNGDPVAEFLFEKKKGYCEYFATAAVLLLRAQGVPARFVKGLSVGPHNHYGGDLFVVRESDAHAWVEAYLPGEGWVEADPTPAADFAAAHAPPGRWSQAMEAVRAKLVEAWVRLTGQGLESLVLSALAGLTAMTGWLQQRPWLLALLALAVAAAVLFRPARRRWRKWHEGRVGRRELAVPRELLLAIEELERRWRQMGHPRPRNRGLLEHARVRAGARAKADDGRDPDLDLVGRYYAARFGGAKAGSGRGCEETRTAGTAGS